MPTVGFGDTVDEDIAFILNKLRYSVAKERAELVNRDIGVLNCVMEGCRRQEFLVGSDGGYNLHRFERMDDVRKAFSPALRVMMCVDRKDDCAVQEVGIYIFIRHRNKND